MIIISSYFRVSSDTLDAQRHSQVQEATAEMMWRDAHSADVLSHLRSELRHYHLHADGKSDAFQQSQA